MTDEDRSRIAEALSAEWLPNGLLRCRDRENRGEGVFVGRRIAWEEHGLAGTIRNVVSGYGQDYWTFDVELD